MDIASTLAFLSHRRSDTPSTPFLQAQIGAHAAVVLQLARIGGVGLWLGRRSNQGGAFQDARVKLTAIGQADENTSYAIEGVDRLMQHTLDSVLGDSKVRAIAAILASLLYAPLRADAMFVELIIAALRMHLSSLSCLPQHMNPSPRSGLAPWQERLACQLLLERLNDAPALEDVAEACRLSPGHFVRAFRRSTGLPPHRWLLERRVDHSKQMLVGLRQHSLAEIALECGFSDQSHFTRTFARVAGTTPGAWRRACGAPA
jgi:AraC-like DNA-binding protein